MHHSSASRQSKDHNHHVLQFASVSTLSSTFLSRSLFLWDLSVGCPMSICPLSYSYSSTVGVIPMSCSASHRLISRPSILRSLPPSSTPPIPSSPYTLLHMMTRYIPLHRRSRFNSRRSLSVIQANTHLCLSHALFPFPNSCRCRCRMGFFLLHPICLDTSTPFPVLLVSCPMSVFFPSFVSPFLPSLPPFFFLVLHVLEKCSVLVKFARRLTRKPFLLYVHLPGLVALAW